MLDAADSPVVANGHRTAGGKSPCGVGGLSNYPAPGKDSFLFVFDQIQEVPIVNEFVIIY